MAEKIIGYEISTGRAALVYLLYGKIYFGGETGFEKVFNVITFIFAVSSVVAMAIYLIVEFFYDGREVRIFVVRKRKNLYKTYHWKYGTGTEEHYVVYAKYPNSDKVHTLGCDGYTYRKLRANKGYNVTVKLMRITKVHREKLKSKKKR